MALKFIDWANQYQDHALKGIARVIDQTSQLMPLLPVQQVDGLIHKYGKETFQGEVGPRQINNPFPDTRPGQVVPQEEPIMIAGAKVKTDYRLAKGTNARADEQARRTQVLSRYIDRVALRGSRFVKIDGNPNVDTGEINGMTNRLANGQDITVAANGGLLTLDLFHQLIDAVDDQGAGKFVMMNRQNARKLKDLIIEKAGGATVADLAGPVPMYEDVKIIVSKKDETGNETLPFTEKQGTSAITAAIYCIAPGTLADRTGVQILMASNSIELIEEGVRDSQHHDVIEVAFGLAVYHDKALARLKGIKQAA